MSFWGRAEDAAAREFGRRHYRGIIAVRVVRTVAGPLAGAAAVLLGMYALARYVWPAVAGGAPAAWRWSANLVPGLVVAACCLVAVPVAVVAWRRWGWEVEARAPWLTGRVVSVVAGVAFLGVMGLAAAMMTP